jgi:hypothetical protein
MRGGRVAPRDFSIAVSVSASAVRHQINGPASAPAATERVQVMTNCVFAYSGGNGGTADDAERNAQYAKWGQWFAELGLAVVEGGAATQTAAFHRDRACSHGGSWQAVPRNPCPRGAGARGAVGLAC